MSKSDNPKVSWGHQGSIGKWHVDLTNPDGSKSHHPLNPPPCNGEGHKKVKGFDQLPAPYGPIK